MDKTFKLCTKCGTIKPTLAFSLHKRNPSGFNSECKECTKVYREKHKDTISAYAKKYYKVNKVKLVAAANNYRENNKEDVKKVRKAHYEANKNKLRDLSKAYYQANKEERLRHSKEYEEANRECINKRRRDARNANPEETKAKSKMWREKNKDKVKSYSARAYLKIDKERMNKLRRLRYQINKEKINARDKERRETEPKYKLNQNISKAIRASLGGNKNGRHWEDIVGYSLKQLKRHLEKRFTKGMVWENYGEWQIDHKIPKFIFNFTKPEHDDFKKCWALSNLQPMWAGDNAKKGVSLSKHFQPSLGF